MSLTYKIIHWQRINLNKPKTNVYWFLGDKRSIKTDCENLNKQKLPA